MILTQPLFSSDLITKKPIDISTFNSTTDSILVEFEEVVMDFYRDTIETGYKLLDGSTDGYQNSPHGIIIDPEGKIWVALYKNSSRQFMTATNDIVMLRGLHCFMPDGSPASFSPIEFFDFPNGTKDTLSAGNNYNGLNRGLTMMDDGNILLSSYATLYKIDYQTGAGLAMWNPKMEDEEFYMGAITEAAHDPVQDLIYVGHYDANKPIYILDEDLVCQGIAVDSTDSLPNNQRSILARTKSNGIAQIYSGTSEGILIFESPTPGNIMFALTDTLVNNAYPTCMDWFNKDEGILLYGNFAYSKRNASKWILLDVNKNKQLSSFGNTSVALNDKPFSYNYPDGSYSPRGACLYEDSIYTVDFELNLLQKWSYDNFPIINITPIEINNFITAGNSFIDFLTIKNNSINELKWNISFEFPDQNLESTISISPVNEPNKDESNFSQHTLITQNNGGPDNFGYIWKDSDDIDGPIFEWIDISTTGIELISWVKITEEYSAKDEGYAGPIPLSFAFPFYGEIHNQFYIASNGFLCFDSLVEGNYSNYLIPDTKDPNNLIIPFWDDLNGNTGSVFYQDLGNKFIIQYTDWELSESSEFLNFQVHLHKNGEIDFLYNDMNGNLNKSSIGIENFNGSDGLQIAFNSDYIHSQMAIQIINSSPHWFNVNTLSGTLSVDESIDIELYLDATDLIPDVYTANLIIKGNTSEIIVPIELSVTDTVVEESPSFGLGTIENPYQISSLNNLYWISQHPEEWSKYYIQTEDIEAFDIRSISNNMGWSPIGNDTISFSGSYNGQGHTINNIYIGRDTSNNIGFFGKTNKSIISCLGLTNLIVNGNMYTGGLIGYNESSKIYNCYTSGISKGSSFVGGLIGSNESYSKVMNCFSTGSVDINTSNDSVSIYVGGLIGVNQNKSMVNNCYSESMVTGSLYIGGLIGFNNNSSIINNCYSIGSVSADSIAGGLLGQNNESITNNSFWDIELSGQSLSAGGTGKPSLEMSSPNIYTDVNWNFIHNWSITSALNNGYPYLNYDYLIDSPSSIAPLLGIGSENDPFQIENIDHLYWISQHSEEWNKHFIQTEDIDAYGTIALPDGWPTIGYFNYISNDQLAFTGSYDGLNHSISNLYSKGNDSTYTALFGWTSHANLRNLRLNNLEMTSKNSTSGLIGTMEFTSVSNCSTNGNITAISSVSGLCVNISDSSTIESSFSNCNITGINGVANFIYTSNLSTISDCYSQGSVTGLDTIGGLIGLSYDSQISNCYSISPIIGLNDIGGLISFSNTSTTVSNSFWDTQASGQTNSSAGIGKNNIEMKLPSTFEQANWDFQSIWGISRILNDGYPFLQSFTEIPRAIPPSQGDGSLDDPYQIDSLEHLFWISECPSEWNKFYIQTNDIDAEKTNTLYSGFSPIGNYITMFSGSYNGQGHIIDNLYMVRDTTFDTGLFGYTHKADIRYLGLKNVNIMGEAVVGALSGYNVQSNIEYCFSTGEISGTSYLGGLVGWNYYSTINNCYSIAAVNGMNYVGGLVGENGLSSSINTCYSSGAVSGTDNTGGFAGNNLSSIDSCLWDIQSSGQAISDGAIGKTTSEMKFPYTFIYNGWDFPDTWMIVSGENNAYPILTWERSGVATDKNKVPYEFALQQNFPNPFNPTTTIKFTLSKASNVSLIIYDISGKKARTLINNYKYTGNNSILWNGCDDSGRKVSSGVYIYRLISGELSSTKKMLFMK